LATHIAAPLGAECTETLVAERKPRGSNLVITDAIGESCARKAHLFGVVLLYRWV